MVSSRYTQHWKAVNEWLGQRAPQWVRDVIEDGSDTLRGVAHRWIYVGLINEAGLLFILGECDDALIQTPRIRRIRKLVNAARAASKKTFEVVDETTMPNHHEAVKLVMLELHDKEFVEKVSKSVKEKMAQ